MDHEIKDLSPNSQLALLRERHMQDTLSLIKRISDLREGLQLCWDAARNIRVPIAAEVILENIETLADMYLTNDFKAGRYMD